jgi:hypothetical protein
MISSSLPSEWITPPASLLKITTTFQGSSNNKRKVYTAISKSNPFPQCMFLTFKESSSVSQEPMICNAFGNKLSNSGAPFELYSFKYHLF